MKVFISIVSHNHFSVIRKLSSLPRLAEYYNVVIIDNVNEYGLSEWCKKHNIKYLSNQEAKGFGENNNIIFEFCQKHEGLQEDDWFLVLNPDVAIEPSVIANLIQDMNKNNQKIAAINLFKDFERTRYDNSIRSYPRAVDFASSYIFGVNKTIIDKSKIDKPTIVDWASGSFLMFNCNLYRQLGGFDTRYFMYCEDIDICYRANQIHGEKVVYYPQHQAIHLAAHSNRKLFSKSFIWHVKSIIRFLCYKNGLENGSRKNILS
ncbi:glycosyltransferase [Kosakonia sacchari]|uniref:Glycosyltransferase family 2 protein n=1 Tax=Kosakonia sacchari TaxID=1158459 RepID=A0A1G4YG05_9ENTR|nr:glycosyltransferase family 2 protein [Kosakonia sacchari]AHJ73334.1 glycosyl transferase family 2 [Kosakonia sacchari SP1]SCX52441.1 hypothetical protein SAMN02927897_02684 [Kosakonia sacchari]